VQKVDIDEAGKQTVQNELEMDPGRKSTQGFAAGQL
jgi:hypothetical protein